MTWINGRYYNRHVLKRIYNSNDKIVDILKDDNNNNFNNYCFTSDKLLLDELYNFVENHLIKNQSNWIKEKLY